MSFEVYCVYTFFERIPNLKGTKLYCPFGGYSSQMIMSTFADDYSSFVAVADLQILIADIMFDASQNRLRCKNDLTKIYLFLNMKD